MLASRSAHQHEGGDIGDREEQDERHRASEEANLPAGGTDDGVAERLGRKACRAVLEAGGPDGKDAHADVVEIASSLFERHAFPEPGHAIEAEGATPIRRGEPQRHPDGGRRSDQVGLVPVQHTGNGVAHAIDRHRLPDGVRRAAQRPLGVLMRNDHHGRRARVVIAGLDDTAICGPHTERLEKSRSSATGANDLGAARTRHGLPYRSESRQQRRSFAAGRGSQGSRPPRSCQRRPASTAGEDAPAAMLPDKAARPAGPGARRCRPR